MWSVKIVVVNYCADNYVIMLYMLPVATEIAIAEMLIADTISASFKAADLPFNS
jgi:hypothetical protein